jgi:hypothetical protein
MADEVRGAAARQASHCCTRRLPIGLAPEGVPRASDVADAGLRPRRRAFRVDRGRLRGDGFARIAS